MNSGPNIAVIMPVYNAVEYLKRSLPILIAMRDSGEIDELLVVDDCSTDDTPDFVRSMGVDVASMEKNGGPGAARNFAAQKASSEILWFVDADVIAQTGSAQQIKAAFVEGDVVAVFGSYDDKPPAQNFASQYKNLVHRFFHQKGKAEASTFWAGCGAVRKDKFLELGGFDIDRYQRPSIEDIELGYRMRANGGKIRLLHDLHATHLKEWTLTSMIHTDVFCRAIPWTRLMLNDVGMTDDLNVGFAERARAMVAGLLFLSLFVSALIPNLFWIPIILLILAFITNSSLFGFFVKCRGIPFAIAALLYHQVYYLYSGVVFVGCLVESFFRKQAHASN